MKEQLTLAYSPCPNDTFLFYHLIHEDLSNKFSVKEELHDVEKLNEYSEKNTFDVTKLSFFAFFHVISGYTLLNSGSALGRGCGPLLVKKKGKDLNKIKGEKILVPGIKTTANLLTNIYLNRDFEPYPIRYDWIMNKILEEEFNLGVIIHEERFTYEERGLEKIVDLGDYWESLTGKPIPLGAIAIKRSIPIDLKREFDQSLRKSLELAYQFPEKTKKYILTNSQVKDEKVVQSHIDLYVNEFTKDIGDEGKDAVYALYEKAKTLGFLKDQKLDMFI
ncbi:MAG TPA: 1,4-dihydroxy-6-naphthoate synthase [Leptospiraceae bacterium]|nr:1,4-dihydroxy-6-naphthoate synthase [Leptospiraceae bacterium]HMW06450.1 1,4-dihydroxy-6-naphthoate synthase [Leptospiraceae bacterium]HMX32448.1 1,4-dihydroxy-6-naphthoate synthase [Leptospiraceae bacterium]HMY33691.1 1,4-dihydroxy-6-naphthoate synthase [Leptospiraceae bacterium]HMZ67504.1 1,4-dihydroxy-6-naphthoate synthase [Leptospiraceae bacterium]